MEQNIANLNDCSNKNTFILWLFFLCHDGNGDIYIVNNAWNNHQNKQAELHHEKPKYITSSEVVDQQANFQCSAVRSKKNSCLVWKITPFIWLLQITLGSNKILTRPFFLTVTFLTLFDVYKFCEPCSHLLEVKKHDHRSFISRLTK